MKSNSKKYTPKRKIEFILVLTLFSIFIIFGVAEIGLRVIPIPGVKYDVSKYDTLTDGGYYPNSIYYYRNDRGDFIKRKINKWGYLDKDFKQRKEESVTRIGFFGDSYTAGKQVELEQTFHFLTEKYLRDLNVETLSFGVEGYSTWQSYLTSNKWKDFFDIDLVVYVFFENDLGDQIKILKKLPISYPIFKHNHLIVDNSFRKQRDSRLKLHFRIMDYLTANSLFLSTLSDRFHLLMKYGVKMKVTKEDKYLTNDEREGVIKYPPNLRLADTPSHWPDSLKDYAKKLEKLILLKWKKEIEENGKSFVILYTPRDILTPTNMQDSWKPWLYNLCLQNNIPFIDPTEKLKEIEMNGNEVFYDHYTIYGHKAVADTFTDWFLRNEENIENLDHI